ncbi:unnamed protein product [Leptidea sinapis]|uniref:FAM20 C-terminal domain-containing protein n=1 Tax=Leptidea sinapis TaxID=189913 RepID=A0A5E4PR20_9NEOP|nr:unnamed protein product [Leptidea sinapis]
MAEEVIQHTYNQKTKETKKSMNELINIKNIHKPIDIIIYNMKSPNCVVYNHFSNKEDYRKGRREYSLYKYCFISVCLSFTLGFVIGAFIMGSQITKTPNFSQRRITLNNTLSNLRTLNSVKVPNELKEIETKERDFTAVSFTGDNNRHKMDIYPKSLTEDMKEILKDNKVNHHKHKIENVFNTTLHVPNSETILYENIFWGPEVENAMPQGYGESTANIWEKYVNQSEIVKMEAGCGRMQNRLVTFNSGLQACVRYRQNTDQIQGEIFSFYVARLLNLTNLAPSVVKVVDLKDKLWANVANDISNAQWNTNRAVVLTQFIPSLESATIPEIFKPSNRHLNKNDILEMVSKEKEAVSNKQFLIDKIKSKSIKAKNDKKKAFDHIDMKLSKKTTELFVELAQWSDLIIFDYLTANLDRIVNNLFNYQWNVNIMDGPAHNLARKMDSGLLVFLDNESGLLHGYRLLKKYNVYHSLMLDNLCVFRKKTVDSLKTLHQGLIGEKLSDIFHKKNNAVIRDILPPLPEKNAKILHERIGKVLSQIEKCEQSFGR